MGKAPATSNQEDSEDWNSLEKHLRPPERKKLLAIYFVVIVAALATLGFRYYLYDSRNRQFVSTSPDEMNGFIRFTSHAWATPSATTVSNITLTIRSIGVWSEGLSIISVTVNNATGVTVKETNGTTATFPKAMAKDSPWSFVVSISGNFQRGTEYSFMGVTSKGGDFWTFITAP